jgi:uncharacterized protein YjbI with pentapeptide repeats
MQLKKLRDFLNNISEKPILTTSLVFAIFSVLVASLSFPLFKDDPISYLKSILIEAHSMLFDLAIIGILLLWLNKSGEKRIRIKRNQDEIDDIRFWKSEEASYKILANIKRLMRDDVNKLDLNNCYLKNINLNFVNLKGSNLNYADLEFCSLIDVNLNHARLNQANFMSTNLNRANLSDSLLSGANMQKTKGIKTNFEKACLIKANLTDAFLIDGNFQFADLTGADFDNANLYMPDFRGAKGLLPEQLAKAKIITKPKLDDELLAEINLQFPDLIKAANTGDLKKSDLPGIAKGITPVKPRS